MIQFGTLKNLDGIVFNFFYPGIPGCNLPVACNRSDSIQKRFHIAVYCMAWWLIFIELHSYIRSLPPYMIRLFHICYNKWPAVFVATAGALGSVKDQLTKVMLQGAHATTIPIRNANDTVDAELGLTLIQVIELVCIRDLSLEPISKWYITVEKLFSWLKSVLSNQNTISTRIYSHSHQAISGFILIPWYSQVRLIIPTYCIPIPINDYLLQFYSSWFLIKPTNTMSW